MLPTYGEAQHALRSALHRWDARGLWDAPFVTFTSAGERFLPGFRVGSLPSAEERDRLMERALEEADPPVFRASRAFRGLRDRLLKLLKDVKQGAGPLDLAFDALGRRVSALTQAPAERLKGFLDVARTYQRLLAQAGLEDHEDALARLRASLEAGPPPRPPGLLVVDGFDDMTPVEVAILLALARHVAHAGGEVLVTLAWEEARAGLFASAGRLRARLLEAGFAERRLTGFLRRPGGALERLALGFGAPPAGPATPGGDEVRRLEALDPADETERVAGDVRALLDEVGRPGAKVRGPRDVLLVVPNLEERGPAFARALERVGVPCHVSGPLPLAAEPWARAAAAPLALLAGDVDPGTFDAARLLDTLRWTAASRADSDVLDALEMRWRREGFPGSWEAFQAGAGEALRPRVEALERERVALAAAGAGAAPAALVAALDRVLPMPAPAARDAEGRSTDPAHDRALVRALETRRRVRALAEERGEAARRVGAWRGGADAARDVLDALERASLAPRERRLDVVHLLSPEAARGWEAEVVYVVGLEERSLPHRVHEDPLLGDRDREVLAGDGATLPTSAEREARERRRVLAVLTRARRQLVLSRPRSGADGDPLAPARLLAALEPLVDAPAERGLARLAPGAPALALCRVPADLLHHAAARVGKGGGAGAALLLQRLDEDLPRRAARWRRGAADPLPPESLARFVRSMEVVSPSRLGDALTCAQRHFLLEVVGLDAQDAPLRGPRFEALDMGRAVHAALELALREPKKTPEDVAACVLEDVALEGLDREALAAELARMVALLRAREAQLRARAAQLRAHAEDRGAGMRPALDWLERDLGAAAPRRGRERAAGEHVPTVALGPPHARFLLRGTLDRVDLAADGRRAIVADYKTGAGYASDLRKRTGQGLELQLPLYARALEVAHGLEVLGLEWIAARTRDRFGIYDEALPGGAEARREAGAPHALGTDAFRDLLDAAEALAADVVERTRAGEHSLAPRDADDCSACAVRLACRPDPRAVEAAAERRQAASAPGGAS